MSSATTPARLTAPDPQGIAVFPIEHANWRSEEATASRALGEIGMHVTRAAATRWNLHGLPHR